MTAVGRVQSFTAVDGAATLIARESPDGPRHRVVRIAKPLVLLAMTPSGETIVAAQDVGDQAIVWLRVRKPAGAERSGRGT
jgi:hypothetical protein